MLNSVGIHGRQRACDNARTYEGSQSTKAAQHALAGGPGQPVGVIGLASGFGSIIVKCRPIDDYGI